MHFLDFLSESPKIFIFEKPTTKTNFGGVLFLIYIITMALISFAYIYSYHINEKYDYEGMTFYNYIKTDMKGEDDVEINKLNTDEKLNPSVDFKLGIDNKKYQFAIYDSKKKEYLKDKENFGEKYFYYFSRRVTDFNIQVRYICDDDKNCSHIDIHKKLIISYIGSELNHTGEIPLKKTKEYQYLSVHDIPDSYNGKIILTLDWEVIKYKEQKSLFDSLTRNEKEYTYGHIKRDHIVEFKPFNPGKINIEKDDKIGYYIVMYEVKINFYHYKYLFYKRKKIELLDVLANIGALFSTIKFFFDVVFQFYTKNFNNYKILGKILNTSNEPIKKVKISADFANYNDISSPKKKEEKEGQMVELENIDPLIDNTSSKENKLNIKEDDINNDINENNIDESTSVILKKLSFYDFFFNNIYVKKCCRKMRNQEIIDTVNEILYKYLSIDNLLYNQLKLENLFKDYKWNNLSLNDIQNNQLIKKLKKI